MPIYSYKCDKEHITDTIISYKDREETQICSDCGEPSYFEQTFCTNFQYGKDYSSFGADRHKWNLRENHRNKTAGKSYD
jgi:hypothetical protein